jgi:sporulation protein YlmC with PRC-barrel domain
MKIQKMTAVSALALMLSLPAYAADISAPAVSGPTPAASSAPENNTVRATENNFKAFFIGKDSRDNFQPVLINRSMTAHGLIGETVINTQGEKVADVKDIIVDKDGKARLVVVSGGGVLGIGSKVAAFDYDKVVEQQPDGKVVMTLSDDMISHAKDFSYDQKDWRKAKVIPAGSVSVNAMLKGDVMDNRGKKVANVENVYFRNADVSQVIVGFNKKLGMGGDLAALNYDDLRLIKKTSKEVDFKLSANQASHFKNFKKSVD